MWTPTTITSHVSEHAQKVRLLLCSCDVLFMLSPNFIISHKKEYVSIFCTWSLFMFFSLCFYQKDLPLPRKNSRWVLPLFNPSFLLSIPLSLPPIHSLGKAQCSSWTKKQSYQAAVHLVYQSLSSRAYMRLGSSLGSQACFSHSVWKLWGCFSSAQGVECGFLVWKRRMRSPEVMLECVEAFLGQLGAPSAVHGAESHAAFSNLFQIVKFLLSA